MSKQCSTAGTTMKKQFSMAGVKINQSTSNDTLVWGRRGDGGGGMGDVELCLKS